jgi:predicted GH43/DUF377 family glycosyl hydrolase
MAWRRLGHIYAPAGRLAWARAYAANPVAMPLGGGRYRIYFSTRDADNHSSVGYVEIDMREPFKVLAEAEKPVLTAGELAMFDDSGASIGCIVPVGEKHFLYYMGWHLTVRVPWQNAIGLAVSDDGGLSFRRHARFPVLPLDEVDPYTITYPWVMWDSGRFRMWYGSNIAWGPEKGDMRCVIKYAESDDGLAWRRDGTVAIGFKDEREYAIVKPCVLKDADRYRMWFCARGDVYRIYLAESDDGTAWTRHPEPALDTSSGGWDSEMVGYPFVFDHDGGRYMLYAGNTYGRTGFGLAVLD